MLLSYPNFNKLFDIHTDASNLQLGNVISQNSKPIAFYSRILNPAQTRYTTTEKSFYPLVKHLKNSKTFSLGKKTSTKTIKN